MTKYETLINILDQIISECPKGKLQSKYDISSDENRWQSRSRSYVHLFLMSKFGLLDFENRERFITDGSYDGGIDAYYIDKDEKNIYFVQSKFRRNGINFEQKDIQLDELASMDISRIMKGEEVDEDNNKYNGKIAQLQRDLQELSNPGQFQVKVIILANTKCKSLQLRKITGGYDVDIYDYNKSYIDLVFPVISGNYYSRDELVVNINLLNSEHPRIKYNVVLNNEVANITVLFVPTFELAKALDKYKNSVLKYNPRSYLDLKNNKVNKAILNTLENNQTNEFALFNNGVTIVARSCDFSDSTGTKNTAKLTLNCPQIINGGQTAYTLSIAFQKYRDDKNKLREVFSGKEVLVKIISFSGGKKDIFDDVDEADSLFDYSESQLDIIERVSEATNMQSPIDEADRKANDKNHVRFQAFAYQEFDMYYERKRGEFGDGISRALFPLRVGANLYLQ